MDVGIQKKKPMIEELLNTIEIDREQIRGRWPSAKDPEKYQMERVATIFRSRRSHCGNCSRLLMSSGVTVRV